MPDVIQGKWDDLVKNHDLRGHIVRVNVLNQQHTMNPWLRSLQAWADSRESIYSGTADDPR